MNQFYQAKFKELFIEFTRYIIENPEFSARIPDNAHIVLLDYKDPTYSLQAIQFAQTAKNKDNVPNRPIIYIEVKEMAPIRSRLQKVDVLQSPPQYVTA